VAVVLAVLVADRGAILVADRAMVAEQAETGRLHL